MEDRAGERWQVECLGEPVEVGARVVFEPVGDLERRQGQIVRLVEAARAEWVCTLRRGPGGCRLSPFGGVDAPEFSLAERATQDAPDGSRVLVVEDGRSKGARPKPGRKNARRRSSRLPVRVVEVLGPPGDPESDHRAVAWKYRLTSRFPRRARLETESIAGSLPEAELDGRSDLRHLPFVTIDPARARDHDDAVFAEVRRRPGLESLPREGAGEARVAREPRGWSYRLWVAIADVGHFVAPGSAIDAEARRRGNSFYFPDRAIPMLPERLSSDLCSLKPDVDRLAMVVELRLAADGRVASADFHEAVIRSRARLAYEEASDWLEADGASQAGPPSEATRSPLDEGAPEWGASLRCLDQIATAFARLRREAGAVELELPEVEIQVDAAGRPVDARLRARNRAHILIEESMLAANRAVAGALTRRGCGTIHRVHPPPSLQKRAAFEALVGRLGLGEGLDLDEPRALARLLDQARGTPSEERVHMAALRSMSQARYAPESGGHDALRFEHYAHFTSPIRRYADLDVHRALKALLRDRADHASSAASAPVGPSEDGGRRARLGIWLSGRERVAVEVERDAQSLATCALMRGREGERFEARVMSATEFGAFIRLESPAVSGLLPMRLLPGSWLHDPEEEALLGDRSGARIGLGDSLWVVLHEVDGERGRLAFRLG